MITVPQLDPVSQIQATDVIMITHADGTTEKITGENFMKAMAVDVIAENNMNSVTSNAVARGFLSAATRITMLNTYIQDAYLYKKKVGNICVITGWILVSTQIPVEAVITSEDAVPRPSVEYVRSVMQAQGICRSIEVTSNGCLKIPNTTSAIDTGWWDINITYPCL